MYSISEKQRLFINVQFPGIYHIESFEGEIELVQCTYGILWEIICFKFYDVGHYEFPLILSNKKSAKNGWLIV
jgi:hypothetical protein